MKERNYKFTDKKSMLDSSFSTLADKKQWIKIQNPNKNVLQFNVCEYMNMWKIK
jgi:cytochrome c1